MVDRLHSIRRYLLPGGPYINGKVKNNIGICILPAQLRMAWKSRIHGCSGMDTEGVL